MGRVQTEGRQCAIYSLAEIGRLISNFPALSKSKVTFPGAVITKVRQTIADPLYGAPEHQAEAALRPHPTTP
jgi:hypothetical protein